jgi:hypothetical protein
MNVVYTRCTLLVAATAALLTAGCSRQEAEQASDRVSSAAEQAANAINKEIWVDDVQLSSAAGNTSQNGFSPGQTLELSMSVKDAPPGTVVTTYWYGPNNRQLSYESQTVDANKRQLNFQQENTHAWPAGSYRAEVWVGDDRVEEERFDIVSG